MWAPEDVKGVPLRGQLATILDWEDAHVGFEAALRGVAPDVRGVVPAGLPHSLWQLLEHMRICQRDILDFCTNAGYVELPADRYFAPDAAPPTARAWDESLEAFRGDLAALKRLVADPAIDLYSAIPHGSGQTYLREVLLVADHNAYTIGQIVIVRRLLGTALGGSAHRVPGPMLTRGPVPCGPAENGRHRAA